MPVVTGKTVVYGVFGDPVGHSLSPLMHNAAFLHCAIDATYVPFSVTADQLAVAVASSLHSINLWSNKWAFLKVFD